MKITLRAVAIYAAPVLAALMAIVAVEVTVRLQVTLADLVETRDAAVRAGMDSLQQAIAVSIERTIATRKLAVQLANMIAGLSVVGAVLLFFLGPPSRLVRYSCFAVVVLLLARAYFWSVV